MAKARSFTESYPNLEEELKDTQQAHFSPEAMIAAVANKKARRALKGKKLNCFVLDREAEEDELVTFLNFLESERTNIPDGTRFQIVYRTKTNGGYHWSTADIRLKGGKFNFFLIDAPNFTPSILLATHAINKTFPESIIKYSGLSIQQDGHNCATFSLDHAYRLAKIDDLYDHLNPYLGAYGDYKNYTEYLENTFEKKNSAGTTRSQEIIAAARPGRPQTFPEFKNAIASLQMVSAIDFPPHFGPLLRNAQNFEMVNFNEEEMTDEWLKKLKKMKGSDFKDLKSYIEERTEYKFAPTLPVEPKRLAIHRKRSNIKRKTLAYLSGKDKSLMFAYNKDFRGRILGTSVPSSLPSMSSSSLSSASSSTLFVEQKFREEKKDEKPPILFETKGDEVKSTLIDPVMEKINKVDLITNREELKSLIKSLNRWDLKNKDLLIALLKAYIRTRKNEVDDHFETRQYLSFFGGISAKDKFNAVIKLLDMLENNFNVIFDVNDIDAFNNGLLKDIIRKFKPILKTITEFDFQHPGNRQDEIFPAVLKTTSRA